MSGRIVGIDLGTTNSEVAVLTERGVVVLEEDGDAILPSCVGLAPDGRVLVGREALHQEVLHPDRTVRSVKRLMGSAELVHLGSQTFRPQEVSALILGALRARAERILGERVTGAVITVPAYFSEAQRQATREAGEIAGLEVARILNEPTAASLAVPGAELGRRTVMVYDLGGGTFDVSIVRQENDVTEVLASHGNVHLGGDDFDTIVLEHLLEQEPDIRQAAAREAAVRIRLRRAAEAARRRLSEHALTRVREDSVCLKGAVPIHLDRPIDRGALEAWIAPLLEKTVESVHRALEDAGLKHGDIDEVVLAGGATRTPAVARLLEEATGRRPSPVLHPDLCVALGAGLVAARIEGRSDASVLVDVTPYTFGIRCVDFDERLDMHLFRPLIRRNTALPFACTERFGTVLDGQKKVHIEVFQGDDPDVRNDIAVGDFRVDGLADVPAGNEILVSFRLDVNGMLEVQATEGDTGRAGRIEIQGAVGRLGAREVERARGRMAELLGQDAGGAGAGEATRPAAVSPETSALAARARAVLASLAAEDRAEAERLLAEIEAAGPGPDGEATARQLEDLLFYASAGGA